MKPHFPRCYVDVNREPYELDPRMFDGRLPSFANTRSMRVAVGSAPWRAWSATPRKYPRSAHCGRRSAAPHRRPLQARTSPRLAAPVHAPASRFRRCHADRLPLHAVGHRSEKRAPARRFGARRPLRHEMRSDLILGPDHRRDHARLRRNAQSTSPMPAASSPARTAIRQPACTRSSLRSTGRCIWTSAAMSGRPRLRAWRASSNCFRIASPRSR